MRHKSRSAKYFSPSGTIWRNLASRSATATNSIVDSRPGRIRMKHIRCSSSAYAADAIVLR